MLLIIDNYDSFSYNLFQLAGSLQPEVKVIRNDALNVGQIMEMSPNHILLSPGPGYPKDAGICEEIIRLIGGKIPILGVCLGHQAICEVYGAKIGKAQKLMHGKQSDIFIDTHCKLFEGLPEKISAARYHSLAADRDTIPDVLEVTAWESDGEVMAVQHKVFPVFGVQFHPESILTPQGITIIKNFLEI